MYNGIAALVRTLLEMRMAEEKWQREMDQKVEKLQRSVEYLLMDDEDTEMEKKKKKKKTSDKGKEKESAENAEKDADGSTEGDRDVQIEN